MKKQSYFKKNHSTNAWSPIVGLSLLTLLGGCGKGSDSNAPSSGMVPGGSYGALPVSTGGQCGSGPYSFTDPNCLTDFFSACSRVGGTVQLNTTNTCAIPIGPWSVSSFGGILNPNDTSGPLAGAGLRVKQGDSISFMGTGSWGTADSSTGSFLKIFKYSWTTYSCNKVSIDGVSEGVLGTNQGLPMGLIGTVAGSSEAFFIGSNLGYRQIQNSGILHIGMNAPSDLAGVCGSFAGTLYVRVR